jgi:hypothetical protein
MSLKTSLSWSAVFSRQNREASDDALSIGAFGEKGREIAFRKVAKPYLPSRHTPKNDLQSLWEHQPTFAATYLDKRLLLVSTSLKSALVPLRRNLPSA